MCAFKTSVLKERNFPLFSAVEFARGPGWSRTNFQRNFSIGEVEVADNVIYHKSEYRERRNHFAYFSCSEAIDGFETHSAKPFRGISGLGCATAVEEDRVTDSIAHGWQPMGSHYLRMDLEAGEEKTDHLFVGLPGKS